MTWAYAQPIFLLLLIRNDFIPQLLTVLISQTRDSLYLVVCNLCVEKLLRQFFAKIHFSNELPICHKLKSLFTFYNPLLQIEENIIRSKEAKKIRYQMINWLLPYEMKIKIIQMSLSFDIRICFHDTKTTSSTIQVEHVMKLEAYVHF